MRLRLVMSARGNLFMRELFAPVVAELVDAGVDAEFAVDRFPPPADDLVYAVIPHEFFDTTPEQDHPTPQQLARTVAIMTEQPGTVWYARALDIARGCGAAIDISEVGRVESRRMGLASELLQLGYTPLWDRWGGEPASPRPVDVAFLGSINRRRERYLAGYADVLARRETRLALPEVAPKAEPDPTFVAGDDRLELMARSKIVLNLRAIVPPYFVWQRAVEAISNGAVLVSEHGAGHAPLVPGEHFAGGAPQNLALLADGLLRDPDRLAALRDRAYRFLVDELPLRPGALRLADVASSLTGAPAPSHGVSPLGVTAVGAGVTPLGVTAVGAGVTPLGVTAVGAGVTPLGVTAVGAAESPGDEFVPRMPDFTDPAAEPLPTVDPDLGELRVEHKRLALEHLELRRKLAAEKVVRDGGDPEAIEELHRTPAYDGATPRVSVCVPLFNHDNEIAETLRSVAVSDVDGFELVVLDDASTDGSADVAREFLAQRPWLPALLLRRAVNAGLPRGRNELLQRARGNYALMLDSDNSLYPQAVRKLAAALDGDPGALFSYGVLATFRDDEPEGLLSFTPWHPPVLARRNPIDACALLRRSAVIELGGYTTDRRLHGWEDYELWCRVAAHGGHGVQVPQFVGRYRRLAGSMLSITDLDQESANAALRELHPTVMAT